MGSMITLLIASYTSMHIFTMSHHIKVSLLVTKLLDHYFQHHLHNSHESKQNLATQSSRKNYAQPDKETL